MRRWKVTAEVNMDASHYEIVIVEANTERKARIKGEEKIREMGGVCFVSCISVKEIFENV